MTEYVRPEGPKLDPRPTHSNDDEPEEADAVE